MGEKCRCDKRLSGRCTLECIGKDKCIIECDGENACGGNTELNGVKATDLTVICEDKGSCKGTEVYCGSGKCVIKCDDKTSCEDMIIYKNGADFSCKGNCKDIKTSSSNAMSQREQKI